MIYRRCPPGQALVVYGKVSGGRAADVRVGRSRWVWPLFQAHAYLDPSPLEAAGRTLAIGEDPEVLYNAAVRLLALPRDEIVRIAEEAIAGADDVDAALAEVGLVVIRP